MCSSRHEGTAIYHIKSRYRRHQTRPDRESEENKNQLTENARNLSQEGDSAGHVLNIVHSDTFMSRSPRPIGPQQ